jgi:hypothetical protein
MHLLTFMLIVCYILAFLICFLKREQKNVLYKHLLFFHIASFTIIIFQIILITQWKLSFNGYWVDKIPFWVLIMTGVSLGLINYQRGIAKWIIYYFRVFFFTPVAIVVIVLISPLMGIFLLQGLSTCIGSADWILFENQNYRMQNFELGFGAPKTLIIEKYSLGEKEIGYCRLYQLEPERIQTIEVEQVRDHRLLWIYYNDNSCEMDTIYVPARSHLQYDPISPFLSSESSIGDSEVKRVSGFNTQSSHMSNSEQEKT